MRFVVALVASSSLAACASATGAAEDQDAFAGRPDTYPHTLDDAEVGAGDAIADDAIADETTPPNDDSGAAPDDAGDDTSAIFPTDDTGADDTGDGSIFPIDDAGCAPSCATCGADDGCGNKCTTGACVAGESCVAGACIAPTKSDLLPTPVTVWSGWPRAIEWTIASEAPATIHFTTDGSTPTKSSPGGASPHLFSLSSNATVKWFADDGVAEGAHSYAASIDTALQSGYGYVVDEPTLDGSSPVVVVNPGASLKGTIRYQAFVSSACPLCGEQLVYGIGTNAAGCVYAGSPGVWPGKSGTGTIALTAPSSAGTYDVHLSWALANDCTQALGSYNPLGESGHAEARIGVIVVK